jgi:hypothetical protein
MPRCASQQNWVPDGRDGSKPEFTAPQQVQILLPMRPLFVRRLDFFSFNRIHGTHSLLCEVFLKIGVEREFDIENRAWDSVPVVDKSP